VIGSYSKDYEITKLDHFVKEKFIPLPNVLQQQFDTLASKCLLGIFPEIHNIWLAIDNKLFLWDFGLGKNLLNYEFEDASEILLSVCLVSPKVGVFVRDIEYLLAVSTTTRVTLLGLRKMQDPSTQYELCKTYLTVSSDDVVIIQIISSLDGRIFMCGSDGNIYEFEYQVTIIYSLFSSIFNRAKINGSVRGAESVYAPAAYSHF
jgi:nuclear pore complex protein Nup155